ncbi:hypothetical protein ScPMuIL_003673 [Solemya velum]
MMTVDEYIDQLLAEMKTRRPLWIVTHNTLDEPIPEAMKRRLLEPLLPDAAQGKRPPPTSMVDRVETLWLNIAQYQPLMSFIVSTEVSTTVPPPNVSTVNKKQAKPRGLRTRTKYTPAQLDALERVFTETQYPDSDAMEQLADILDVSAQKISIWFQNRRAKFKRQTKDSQVSWMRKQIFHQEASPPSNNQASCHVLSPLQDITQRLTPISTNISHRSEGSWDKPRSTLHHLPDYAAQSIPFLDLKTPASACNTPEKFPSMSNGSCSSAKTSSLSSAYQQQLSYETSLQLSHLLNDLPISPLFPMSPLPGRQSVFSFPYSPSSPVFYPQTNSPQYSGPVPHQTTNVW